MESLIGNVVEAGGTFKMENLNVTIVIPGAVSREKLFRLAMQIERFNIYYNDQNTDYPESRLSFPIENVICSEEDDIILSGELSGRWS